MGRKGESITLSLKPGSKARLEELALTFGQTWGDGPNVSGLLNALAEGALKIDWGDAEPHDDPKRKARLAAISLIQEGLSKIIRLL